MWLQCWLNIKTDIHLNLCAVSSGYYAILTTCKKTDNLPFCLYIVCLDVSFRNCLTNTSSKMPTLSYSHFYINELNYHSSLSQYQWYIREREGNRQALVRWELSVGNWIQEGDKNKSAFLPILPKLLVVSMLMKNVSEVSSLNCVSESERF